MGGTNVSLQFICLIITTEHLIMAVKTGVRTIKYLAGAALMMLCSAVCAAGTVAPDEEDPYFLLSEQADKAISEGDYMSAAARIKEAISLRPDAIENVLLLSNLGMVYSYMDCDSLALASYNEALKRAPSMTTVLFNRARLLLKNGHNAAARTDLDKVIGSDSLNAEARYIRGMMSLSESDINSAAADFKVLEKVDPHGTSTAVAMTTLYTAQGKLNLALPYAKKVITVDPQPEYYIIAAQALIEDTRYSEAGQLLSEGIAKYPESPSLYSLRGTLHRLLYDRKAAEADEQRAKELTKALMRKK